MRVLNSGLNSKQLHKAGIFSCPREDCNNLILDLNKNIYRNGSRRFDSLRRLKCICRQAIYFMQAT